MDINSFSLFGIFTTAFLFGLLYFAVKYYSFFTPFGGEMNGKNRATIPVVSVCLMMLAIPAICLAHPETGLLPDSSAETEYRIVVEINPKDIKTRNKLGMVLYRKNKLDEAARQFTEVLKIAPNDFDAHDGLGLVSCKNGKYMEAVDWFTKAIAIRPNETMVHYGLGMAYDQLGNLPKAENSYRQALANNGLNLRKGGHHHKVEASRKKIIYNALQKLKVKRARAGGKV